MSVPNTASVTRAYGEMTIGLLVTAAVAILTQATGAYIALIQSLGVIGAWAPFVVEIVIAIYLGARIERSSRAPHASCSTCMPRSWASR